MTYHLAHLNIAKLLKPINHPDSAPFYNNVGRINQLAEQSDGFVWRLIDEAGDPAHPSHQDPLVIATLSVWENLDALKSFSFQTEHGDFVKKRREWFEKLDYAYVVLWYVEAGHQPNLTEALERLKYLQNNGDTSHAFSFRKAFLPTTLNRQQIK